MERDGRAPQLQLLILAAIELKDCHGSIILTKDNAANLVFSLDNGENNLEAQEILNTYWPKVGFYYHSPEKYTANPTQGWPVAADILAYHLKQKQYENSNYNHFMIVPIIAYGKGGRLANTADTVEQWIMERGNTLSVRKNNHPVLLASLSSQPHTMYMHETAIQLLPKNVRLVTLSVTPKKGAPITTVLDVAARLLYTAKNYKG